MRPAPRPGSGCCGPWPRMRPAAWRRDADARGTMRCAGWIRSPRWPAAPRRRSPCGRRRALHTGPATDGVVLRTSVPAEQPQPEHEADSPPHRPSSARRPACAASGAPSSMTARSASISAVSGSARIMRLQTLREALHREEHARADHHRHRDRVHQPHDRSRCAWRARPSSKAMPPNDSEPTAPIRKMAGHEPATGTPSTQRPNASRNATR